MLYATFLRWMVLLFFIFSSYYSEAQMELRDSIAMNYFFKAELMNEKGKIAKAGKYYLKAYETNRNNELIHQKGLAFFIEQDDYNTAKKFFSLVGISSTEFNRRARVFYNKGMMLMGAGRSELFEADASFQTALHNIKKAKYPNKQLFSQILVARGYTKILSRPIKNKGDKKNFILIHSNEAKLALNFFQRALFINPELAVAEKNRDIVMKWLDHCNIIPPELVPDTIKQWEEDQRQNSLDSVSNMHVLDSLRALIYSSLPHNIEQITSFLNQYEEVVLVMDVSGSMEAPMIDGGMISRFEVMKELSQAILKKLDKKTKIGVITVGGDCYSDPLLNIAIDDFPQRVDIENRVEKLQPNGKTPLNRRVDMTNTMFSPKKKKKTILLISDGMDTCYEIFDLCNTTIKLDNNGIDVSVFSFLLEGQNFENDLAYEIYECMTQHSKGKIFYVDKASTVQEKYQELEEDEQYFQLPETAILSSLYPNHDCMYELAIDKDFEFSVQKVEKKK